MILKRLRLKKGLTQQQLADEIGVKRETICMIELGVNTPSIPTAKKLGEFFGVDWKLFYEE